MPDIRKVMVNGKEADAELIEVTQCNEPWNSYILADGTHLKAKHIATRVLRVKNVYNTEGEPVYIVHHNTTLSSNAPASLRNDNANDSF